MHGREFSATAKASGAAKLSAINPFFIVDDFPAAVSYYRDRMGFEVDFQGPAGKPFFGRVSRDGIGVMLKAIDPKVHPRPNRTEHEWARWDAFIYTSNPDELFAEFKERGVSFATELSHVDEGLWGFEVEDSDGYVLCFARVESA